MPDGKGTIRIRTFRGVVGSKPMTRDRPQGSKYDSVRYPPSRNLLLNHLGPKALMLPARVGRWNEEECTEHKRTHDEKEN
jgi:hypothetical protein